MANFINGLYARTRFVIMKTADDTKLGVTVNAAEDTMDTQEG